MRVCARVRVCVGACAGVQYRFRASSAVKTMVKNKSKERKVSF